MKGLAGRYLLPVAAILSLAHVTQFLFFEVFNPLALDYAVYARISKLPVALIYELAGVHPFANPPTSLIFFKPLALVDKLVGYLLWSWLSASLYFFAINRVDGWRNAVWSVCSYSVLSAIALGQATLILGAGLLFAFTLPAFFGGMILGFVLTIKPQLALLAPLALLVRRDWPMFAGMTLAVAVSMGIELLFFGPDLWWKWFQAIPRFQQIVIDEDVIRFVITPAGMAENAGLSSLPFLLAGAMIGGCTIFLLAKRAQGFELAALVCAASIVSVPYSLPHDTVAIVPACVAAIKRAKLPAIPAIGVFASIFPGFWIVLAMILRSVILLKNRVTGASLSDPAGTSRGQFSDDI